MIKIALVVVEIQPFQFEDAIFGAEALK